MAVITLRVRGPNGASTLKDLNQDLPLEEFQQRVASSCGVEPTLQIFKAGYPPRILDVSGSSVLADLGLKHGDAVMLEAGTSPSPVTKSMANVTAADAPGQSAANSTTGGGGTPHYATLPDGRAVVRRIIASDNSCLFNAVGYNMERSRSVASQLRTVVKDTVAADLFTFNSAFLGKENDAYQQWIMNSANWGGAIELFILAKHYGCEIAAFDIKTKRCDIYGQGEGYNTRCLAIYDGLHYDAMAIAAFPEAPEEVDCTVFELSSPDADQIMAAAAKVVEQLHQSSQYTDTASFTLRCGTCYVGLKGEKEAIQHATNTGHQNFQEYK